MDMFHEPFVLFGYLASFTQRLEVGNGGDHSRSTPDSAGGEASGGGRCPLRGRLRLGIGIGWNQVEYEALGTNFHDRGRRSEEQITVMRALWTQEVVNFKGRWHQITDAGLNPLPVQRPIPLWLGGRAEAVVKRVGRLADGWFTIPSR